VYFPVWPGKVVLLSASAARVIGIVAVLGALTWLGLALGRRRVRPLRVLGVLALQVGLVTLVGAASWGVEAIIDSQIDESPIGEAVPVYRVTVLALMAIASILGAAAWSFVTRRTTRDETLAGVMACHAVLTLVATFAFPAGGYLFAGILIGTLAVAMVPQVRSRWALLASGMLGLAAGVMALVLFLPICWFGHLALLGTGTPIVVGLWMVPLTAILAQTAPFTDHLPARPRHPGVSRSEMSGA
jgi:hypothetical protein